MCTYIPFSLDFLGIYVATEHGVELLLLYSRFSLVIYFIHNLLLFKKNFIYFCPALCCSLGFFPLVLKSGGYFLVALCRLLLLRSTGSRLVSFSSCGTWVQQLQPQGSRVLAQYMGSTGLVAPRHVGSSWTRDRTRVSRMGRRILYH